ncbi:globin-coupled sensor protein [Paenibacillus dokdonensis]|uniref:Globin-coupled sensor protein n=1 Tax=Paenibacillus dokdonensis TaxID=2567944 RepID=A0ABU6GGX5_9BACL|nr:globin-coupled sensor protein [Paenibacillus dokdonensis]MEC0238693.1 globin-coupled sensor protein [Paenibacillus dokdonensis]
MINVSPKRQKQIDYIRLTEKDLENLLHFRPVFAKVVEEVVNHFYKHIATEPELMELIGKTTTIERLKDTQREYWMSLADGRIDDEYLEKRIAIGLVHSRIGLSVEYYLGSYMTYLDIATDLMRQVVPEQWVSIIHSLSKMFNLDSQLVLEAYELKEKEKLKDLADEKEHVLQAVTEVVQQLTGMVAELNESAGQIATSAQVTADSQETAHVLMDELHEDVKQIENMGVLIKAIADQTHLLGLNAAIEAAHAGDMGRGFTVVAGEVRKLAMHSREALEQIQDKVSGIMQRLSRVQNETEKTTIHAREQASSSQELASFVTMIEKLTQDLAEIQNKK